MFRPLRGVCSPVKVMIYENSPFLANGEWRNVGVINNFCHKSQSIMPIALQRGGWGESNGHPVKNGVHTGPPPPPPSPDVLLEGGGWRYRSVTRCFIHSCNIKSLTRPLLLLPDVKMYCLTFYFLPRGWQHRTYVICFKKIDTGEIFRREVYVMVSSSSRRYFQIRRC